MSVNKFKAGDVVKCVDVSSVDSLTIGKEYIVTYSPIEDCVLFLYDDNGVEGCYYSYRFELSNSNVTPPQPPKFKEGDMVYLIGFGELKPYKLVSTDGDYLTMKFKVKVGDSFKTFTEQGCYTTLDVTPSIVLATEENRKMLNKLLGVEYEPVKSEGSELARKLLKDKPQTCWVSDVSDNDALSNGCVLLVVEFGNGGFTTTSGLCRKYAVPCNQHGEVLEDE